MIFYYIYDLSLFISIKAFLPSLRVLRTNQEREEIISMLRAISEIRFVSKLVVNSLKFFSREYFKFRLY